MSMCARTEMCNSTFRKGFLQVVANMHCNTQKSFSVNGVQMPQTREWTPLWHSLTALSVSLDHL